MCDFHTLPSGLKEVIKDDSGLEVRIYYLECLAQATYLLTHEENAFIIDPRRDVDAFIIDLKSSNKTLKGILETHFHADFVSGHYELMQKTGATIYFGPTAGSRCKFDQHELKDGEEIEFSSRYSIKTLHTPGHTPESVVYLVIDKEEENKPVKAFTGDTLFIGSCGRPDLVGSIGFTSEQMARMMFHSLLDKICTLPDDVQIFPAHGAGSPCGKNLSSDLHSTIGKEKKTNPALQYDNDVEFIEYLTKEQPTAPGYFSHDVQQNVSGAQPLTEELCKIPHVSGDVFNKMKEEGSYVIIDTRPPPEYNNGFIEGSLNFPLGEAGGAIVGVEDGNFALWVGTLVSSKEKILLLCNQEKQGEALQRLARIGYTNVSAVLDNGIDCWKSKGLPLSTNNRINLKGVTNLSQLISEGYQMLDVRTPGEHENNTCKNSINIPLASIYEYLGLLKKDRKYIAFCTSGYRSVIASSILRSKGYNVVDVHGGFAAISVYNPETTTTGKVCPSMKAMVRKLSEYTGP